MKAIIADDEPHLAQYLRERLAQLWPELDVVALAASGPAALEAIDAHRPDIAFLDIRMPGATGLEVAARAKHRTRIVFVTAYDQYAVEAFERDAIDYLLKPVTAERLSHTIERLKRSQAPAPDLAPLLARLDAHLGKARSGTLRWIRASKRTPEGEITQQIPVADVLYIQADDKYTCVFSREGGEIAEWLIRVPLSDLAAQLDPDDFAQIHRSVIVNMHAVSATRRDVAGKLYVRLRDTPRELPVARQYVHLFRQM
jgi:DNA-binding LytR/AlgR family response regulator